MNKRKMKSLKRKNECKQYKSKINPPICPNCGKPGFHFMTPCFGGKGFYICSQLNTWEGKDELNT